MNDKDIPIFIIQRDRLEYLKQLLTALTTRGYNHIHIVDNKSTYPPLSEFYRTIPFKVHYMDKNYCHQALILSKVLDPYFHDYYAYTDNDIVPDEQCPDDFMTRFRTVMDRHKEVSKVGFGLRIDNLPSTCHCAARAKSWESQFWNKEVEPGVWMAAIDTTFALCRPGAKHLNPPAYRTGFPYVARHMPWYMDNTKPIPDDIRYYVEHSEMPTNWNPTL